MKHNSSMPVYALVILVALSRLVPHPMNVTPIGALGLFSGAYLRSRGAWFVPLCAVLIGDAFLGFYNPVVMVSVYLGFVTSVLIGRGFLFRRRSSARLASAVVLAAVAFYLLSNFGMWLAAYPWTAEGLVSCYVNGLPFFASSLLGDAIYSALLFGLFEAVRALTRRIAEIHVVDRAA